MIIINTKLDSINVIDNYNRKTYVDIPTISYGLKLKEL